MSNKETRIPLWDNLKFLLMLLVVVGHFAENGGETQLFKTAFIFIYSFHMPAFFFVSGLFHTNNRIAQKVMSFLALYVLTKAVIFSGQVLMGKKVSFSLLTESGIPWFMFAMAVFILLTYLFREINPLFVLVLFIFTACFSGFDASIGDKLVLSRIIVFYPFYLAGHIVPQDKLISLREKKGLQIAALLLILIWAAACVLFLDKVYLLRPLFTGRNPFSKVALSPGPLWRLLCYTLTSLLIAAFVLLIPNREVKPFTVFGRRTLQVYFWHRIILYLFSYLGFAAFFKTSHLLQLAWLVIGALTAIILSLKPFGFPTDLVLRFSRGEIGKKVSDRQQ